ncbi:hypothetical protein KKF69_00885 [Patescibacteria group bacterium]|nr:hypothetical protein [Patescibacteria group bacterium]MBU4016011.1 hypothetical protein [Patescibacteria group bacterium]
MRKKTTHSKEAENRQLEVAIRKTRQKTELLVIQPKFREDITKLRVKWNVPSQGLCSDEEFDKWQNSLNQENWKYQKIEYPKFREQYKNDSDYAVKLKYFGMKAPNNVFQQDLAGLVKKYKLSPFWVNGLRGYLLRNTIPLSAGIVIEQSYDPLTGMPILKLVLQEDTSIKDVTTIWNTVQASCHLPFGIGLHLLFFFFKRVATFHLE